MIHIYYLVIDKMLITEILSLSINPLIANVIKNYNINQNNYIISKETTYLIYIFYLLIDKMLIAEIYILVLRKSVSS